MGPISLCGVHLQASPLDLGDDEYGSSESESEDEEVPQLVKPAATKDKIEKVPLVVEEKMDTEEKPAEKAEVVTKDIPLVEEKVENKVNDKKEEIQTEEKKEKEAEEKVIEPEKKAYIVSEEKVEATEKVKVRTKKFHS